MAETTTLPALRAHLRSVLKGYLGEYGGDGYDKNTFVDFVVANAVLSRRASGAKALLNFYRRRVAEIEEDVPALRETRLTRPIAVVLDRPNDFSLVVHGIVVIRASTRDDDGSHLHDIADAINAQTRSTSKPARPAKPTVEIVPDEKYPTTTSVLKVNGVVVDSIHWSRAPRLRHLASKLRKALGVSATKRKKTARRSK